MTGSPGSALYVVVTVYRQPWLDSKPTKVFLLEHVDVLEHVDRV